MIVNPCLMIILSALVVEYLMDVISTYLTLKSLDPVLPSEFDGIYEREKYQQSQMYTRANIKFSQFSSALNFILILIIILWGGFNIVDSWVRGLSTHPVWGGLLFIGILFFIQDIILIPFSIYHSFVIEEKFGFNKMTIPLFILDKLKGYLLAIIFGSLILGTILLIFETFGNFAWIIAWVALTIFTIVLQPVYIHYIAPLFNKFTPLESGELRSRLLAYAARVKFPISGIFVMDGSKRSTHSNAYFTGFGKSKRIVLFDTLLKSHPSSELLTILAHEIGHYKKHHILTGMVISVIHTGVVLYLLSVFLNNSLLFEAFGMTHVSVYASILFFGVLYSPIELALSMGMNILSRRNEFEADHFSVETTSDPENFIRGLKQLTIQNLSNLTPHPFTVFMSYSHPPVLNRIAAVRTIVLDPATPAI